jgi:hypothetical protein
MLSRVDVSRVNFCSATQKVFARSAIETRGFGGFIQIWDVEGGH